MGAAASAVVDVAAASNPVVPTSILRVAIMIIAGLLTAYKGKPEKNSRLETIERISSLILQSLEESQARNQPEDQQDPANEQVAVLQDQVKKQQEQMDKSLKEIVHLKDENAQKDEVIRKAQEEKEKVKEDLEAGIEPEKYPTNEQIFAAKLNHQYRDDHFHFAIAGYTGTGKSSLLNALRGLQNCDPGAAKAGANETTLKIQRYPDTSPNPPFAWFVWYDIPGAGTVKTSGWQYFNEQGLFIFDFIIVTVGDRFCETDIAILKNCERFGIPSFIVRPKADQNINNMALDEGLTKEDAQKKYVKDTRLHVEENLKQAGLDPKKKVYIISKRSLAAFVKQMKANKHKETWQDMNEDIIDETSLVTDLLTAGLERYKADSMEAQVQHNVSKQQAERYGKGPKQVQVQHNVSKQQEEWYEKGPKQTQVQHKVSEQPRPSQFKFIIP